MKHYVAVCAAALLVLPPVQANSRVADVEFTEETSTFETAPLVEWDESDILAQQQPLPVAPTSPTTPTAPVATPPVVAPLPLPTPPTTPAPPPAPPVTTEPETQTEPEVPPEENMPEDDFSIGDIPVVETLELTLDKARKALDTYILVREKYKDAQLEDFENLQDFVDQAPQGKAFEADVKAAGFVDVTEWNTTITTLSFAHDNSIDDQTGDIKQQITELEADTDIADDMRARMITALKAMIPSENNKTVLEQLKVDASFADKLKLLESEAE